MMAEAVLYRGDWGCSLPLRWRTTPGTCGGSIEAVDPILHITT